MITDSCKNFTYYRFDPELTAIDNQQLYYNAAAAVYPIEGGQADRACADNKLTPRDSLLAA